VHRFFLHDTTAAADLAATPRTRYDPAPKCEPQNASPKM
jgi:hypothetical protein